MSNNTNEKQEDDQITVHKIYETLKSGSYLRSLYWDVLSDLKEKDAFKNIKKVTEKLLNKTTKDIENLPDNEKGDHKRKEIVAEICSMSYAIDTVYSKILYMKLQKAFMIQIIEAVKELRKERKIPDSVWSKLQMPVDPETKVCAENSAAKNNSLQQKPESSGRPKRMKNKKITLAELATINREIESEIHEDLKAINCGESKAKSSKNTNSGNQAGKKKASSSSSSVKNMSKKLAEGNQTPSKSKMVVKTVEDNIPKEDMQFDDSESDSDSDISVGNVSLASVSSVHTSELSSYDDDISLSSEDGENGTKRRISIKILKEMSKNGRFSSTMNSLLLKSFTEKEKSEKRLPAKKEKQIESSSDKADSAVECKDSTPEAQSPSQKTLPKRIRKPNSKYSSETILCTIKGVKERKKKLSEVHNGVKSSSNEINSKDTKSSKESSDPNLVSRKRVKSESESSDLEPTSKFMKSVKEENDSDYSSPSQSSVQNKFVRSLTSRKTVPVTLYST